eukprot:gene14278-30382_t
MGAGGSVDMEGSEEQVFERMLPIYYLKDVVILDEDIAAARASWELVTTDSSPEFNRRKGTEGFPSSCLSWYYDSFYEESYALDSSAKALYKSSLKVQVKALVAMIQMMLTIFKTPEKTNIVLTAVANGHTKKGVKAFQYGIVGEVLIKTFQDCLAEGFTDDMKQAWVKIFSYCLKVILPVAIANDRKDGDVHPSAQEAEKSRLEQSNRLQTQIQTQSTRDRNSIQLRQASGESVSSSDPAAVAVAVAVSSTKDIVTESTAPILTTESPEKLTTPVIV